MPDPPVEHPSCTSDEDRRTLLDVAMRSLRYGLLELQPLAVNELEFPPSLRPLRATFVTLELDGQLRGCIGVLEAARPLVVDVAHNAFSAGFRDPRFAPLQEQELPRLQVHISILSPPELLLFEEEDDLIGKLRPGIDGLILEESFGSLRRRGTFLPAVWESLPEPRIFLSHLKRKAGLPPDYWSRTIRVFRYTAESVS